MTYFSHFFIVYLYSWAFTGFCKNIRLWQRHNYCSFMPPGPQ